MQQFTEINKAVTKEITAEALQLLEAFAEIHGLKVTYRKGSYNPADGFCDLTFSFAVEGSDPRRAEWDRYCFRYGLTAEDFGRTFKLGADTYTICGCRPKAPKRPISATKDGKTYSFPLATVKQLLAVA